VKQGRIRVLLEDPSKYYYKVVDHGDPKPTTSPVRGTMITGYEWIFNFRSLVDVYIVAFDFAGLVEFDDEADYTDVFVQDQTSPPIEYFLTQILNPVTITAPAAARTKVLQLQAGHGVIVGNLLEIYAETPIGNDTLKTFQQLTVIDVNIDTITVQPFLEFDLDPLNVKISDRTTSESNVNGSITPQRFRIGPPNGIRWDLTRTMIVMVTDGNPDDGLYGNLLPLTSGVFFGFENDITQAYLVNVQANAGYRATAYDVTYTSRSTGGGSWGVSVRKSFAGQDKYGVAIRLAGPSEDEFVMYINDDLSGILEHRIRIMGHIVE
jgi:hypothetical protein